MIRCIKSWVMLPFMVMLQDTKIFRPWRRTIQSILQPKDYGLLDAEEFLIEARDVKLQIWQNRIDKDNIVICFHGNTGHWGDVGEKERGDAHFFRDYRIHLLKALSNAGFGWYAVSIGGYGGSTKIKPSEKSIISDVRYLAEWLSKQSIAEKEIIVLGESLGAFTALNFAINLQAINLKPKICLIAPFSSLPKRVAEILPCVSNKLINKVLRHKLDNEASIGRLNKNTKMLIIHPELDRTTPMHHGKYLSEVAIKNGVDSKFISLPDTDHLTWVPEEIAKFMKDFS
jgi:pimeloyl-ACP methyl ester carboxylesterase